MKEPIFLLNVYACFPSTTIANLAWWWHDNGVLKIKTLISRGYWLGIGIEKATGIGLGQFSGHRHLRIPLCLYYPLEPLIRGDDFGTLYRNCFPAGGLVSDLPCLETAEDQKGFWMI